MSGRRIAATCLPQLPMKPWREAQGRTGDPASHDLPQVLAVERPHGPIVHAASRAAHLAGVAEGARAIPTCLPQFPMERWRRMQERAGNAASGDVAMALSVEGPHGPVVHAANIGGLR